MGNQSNNNQKSGITSQTSESLPLQEASSTKLVKPTSNLPCTVLDAYGSKPSEMLVVLNPTKVQSNVRKYAIDTNRKALNAQSVKMSQLKKVYGEKAILALIQAWVFDLGNFVGVKEKANESQLRELSELFYEEAYFLNLAEMGLFFNRVKRGKYGEFFGSIDPLKILKFLDEFLVERNQAVAELRKEADRNVRYDPEVTKRLITYYASLKQEKSNRDGTNNR